MLPDIRGRTRRFTILFIRTAGGESQLCGVIRSVTMLVIEQLDGTMALVPEWMTKPAAAAVKIREAPRFPLAELRALRQVAGAVLSLLSDRSNGDRHGISHTPRLGNLFSIAAVVCQALP